jgi:hypothetical protein
VRLVIALALAAVATAAWACPETHAVGEAGAPGLAWQPAKEAVVKWAQLPDPAGDHLASQYASDYPFDARAADDFLCVDGTPIVRVEWWGAYWNPGEPPYAEYFVIRIYSDVPGPPFGHPGDLLYEAGVAEFTEELDGDVYRYEAPLMTPFEQEAGETYWISIQAVHLFFTGGQWGWKECLPEDHWNAEAVMMFPELGVPDWTTASQVIGEYAELAFVLYGEVFNPVESTTWSSVKAMFR